MRNKTLALRLIGLPLTFVLLLSACQSMVAPRQSSSDARLATEEKVTTQALRRSEHRGDDDLVTAGLGLEGLMTTLPAADDSFAPTAIELRRMALHSTWRGLAALNPAGGVGGIFDALPRVEGIEIAGFRSLPGRRSPARLLLQIPDGFDPASPCLVLAPASGSRGVYGAVPLVAPRMLPQGCAVIYTDKGAGSDVFHFDSASGVSIDGRRVPANQAVIGLAFEEYKETPAPGAVGLAHAHSGDHPEADWGLYVLDAAEFAIEQLHNEFGKAFRPAALRVIAAGLSNGGGAVLRAVEQDEDGLIDGVVAVMPNISLPGQPHLYEYATLAALYQPCLLADLTDTMDMVLGNPLLVAAGKQRCESLAQNGLLPEASPEAARERLLEAGFDESALALAASNIALDLWRSVAVTYSSSYLRRGVDAMPCGFRFDASDASPEEVASWWALFSGIAPGSGIELIDTMAAERDPALPGLRCLHALNRSMDEAGRTLRAAIAATRATGKLPNVPVLLVHGREDGLIPAALTSRPYVELARSQDADIVYWEVNHAQHFDALLALPAAQSRLVPILPYGWAGLDHLIAVLDGKQVLGSDRQIQAQPTLPGEVFTPKRARL
ncbi:MAG: 3-hydroxybutyrate oligomer hydrolase family protein [Pseudomonadota bacterium]